MCFSAQASFIAGIVLAIASYASIKKTCTNRELPFAITPLLFAIQQAIEGYMWLAHTGIITANFMPYAPYAYYFFAYLLWPVWVPFILLLMEPDAKRRPWIKVFLALGALTSLSLLFSLTHSTLTAEITQHVCYVHHVPPALAWIGDFGIIAYLLAVAGPLIVSRVSGMWIGGLLLVISCATTYFFATLYFASLWCFFAALMSMGIYLIIKRKNCSQTTHKRLSAR